MPCTKTYVQKNIRKFVAAWTPRASDSWSDIDPASTICSNLADETRRQRCRADIVIAVAMLGCTSPRMPRGWCEMSIDDLAQHFAA